MPGSRRFADCGAASTNRDPTWATQRREELLLGDQHPRPSAERAQNLFLALAIADDGHDAGDRLAPLRHDDLAVRFGHVVQNGETPLLERASRNHAWCHGHDPWSY